METKHFGFVQFEFAGTLPVADGRYLAREAGEDGAQSVLVIETPGRAAAAPEGAGAGQARRIPRAEPVTVPLARATAIRAQHPFASGAEAAAWLDAELAEESRSTRWSRRGSRC